MPGPLVKARLEEIIRKALQVSETRNDIMLNMESKEEGTSREVRSNAEVRAYAAWLRGRRKEDKDGALPPLEQRTALKKTLREVSGRKDKGKEERKAEENAERQRAKELGEARLREVVERGDLRLSFVKLLGAYLECEPWEALKQLEREQDFFKKILRAGRNQADWLSASQRDSHPLSQEDYAKMQSERMLKSALDEHLLAIQFAREMREKSGGSFQDMENTVGDASREKLFSFSEGRAFFPTKSFLERMKNDVNTYFFDYCQLRCDYWTIVRSVLSDNPKEFGFTSKKDVDLLIGSVVEHIGRVFSKPFYFENGTARIGDKSPKKEAIAKQIQEGAEAIVENEREAKRLVEQREKTFKEEMRGMFMELIKLNEKIKEKSTALTRRASMLQSTWELISTNAATETRNKWKEIYALQNARDILVHALSDKNGEVWPGGGNFYKYTSRFKSPKGYTTPHTEDRSFSALVHYWTAIAEVEVERMVDEALDARKKIA